MHPYIHNVLMIAVTCLLTLLFFSVYVGIPFGPPHLLMLGIAAYAVRQNVLVLRSLQNPHIL